MAKLLTVLAALVSSANAGGVNYDEQWNWAGQCRTSEEQSPIDIDTNNVVRRLATTDLKIGAIDFVEGIRGAHKAKLNDYENAHSIKWSFSDPIGSDKLKCPQFHCHFGSEHMIDNKQTFGECHVVCHKAKYEDLGKAVGSGKKDALAVFGFMIKKGDKTAPDSSQIQKLINSKRWFVDENTEIEIEIPMPSAEELNQGYYRYNGGLTTPTCNEVVTWTVFKKAIVISEAQASEISSWTAGGVLTGNARAVQPLGTRRVRFFGPEQTEPKDKMGGNNSAATQITTSMACLVVFSML